jgi:membrane protein YqaA with SNARE-associated domain
LSAFFQSLLHFFIHLNYAGPFIMGILDSSFLFLPFGNDLLVVGLVAHHHQGYLLYVLSAVCGSTTGVFLLDLVARKAGEEGIQKVTGPARFNYLKRKIGQRGGVALVLACIAPPPFPFSPVVATNSALGYPRRKLLFLVAISRAARFLILGYLALRYGRAILRVAKSDDFKWAMIAFIAVCAIGSSFSVYKWVRKSRSAKPAGTPK